MEIEGFQWDEGNLTKCGKHGVTRAEIESLFSTRVLVIEDKANSDFELRFRAIGVFRNRRAYIRRVHAARRLLAPAQRALHASQGNSSL